MYGRKLTNAPSAKNAAICYLERDRQVESLIEVCSKQINNLRTRLGEVERERDALDRRLSAHIGVDDDE